MADDKPSPNKAATADPEITEVQEILTALYEAYRQQSKKRRISDNALARALGVSASNWNYWINGTRAPDLKNALILAPKVAHYLDNEQRDRFLRVLGYPNYVEIDDSRLQYIFENWGSLKKDVKEQLYEIVNSAIQPGPAGGDHGAKRERGPLGNRGAGDQNFDG